MSQFTVDLSSIDEFEASGEDAKMFSDEDIADMMFIEGNVAAPESKEAKSPELARFEIALSKVDRFERKEYEEALRLAPQLVQRETPIEDFLWAENFKAHRAALRYVRYWKARKFLFGDRWLLPLNLTGAGALSPYDIALFQQGYFIALPRPSGGLVLLEDESRIQCAPGHAKTRVAFYLLQVFAKEVRQGLTTMHIVSAAPRSPFQFQNDAWAIYRVALPINFRVWKSIVVSSCFEPGRQELMDFLTFQTKTSVNYMSKREPTRIVGKCLQSTLQLLQQETGVERECIPCSIGGDFRYEVFGWWIQGRLNIETKQTSGSNSTTAVYPSSQTFLRDRQ